MGSIKSNIDDTVTTLENQLALWSAKLDILLAKAKVAKEESKVSAHKHLDDVKTKLEITRAKLADAKTAGGERWDAFKAGVESSWEELEGAFQELTN